MHNDFFEERSLVEVESLKPTNSDCYFLAAGAPEGVLGWDPPDFLGSLGGFFEVSAGAFEESAGSAGGGVLWVLLLFLRLPPIRTVFSKVILSDLSCQDDKAVCRHFELDSSRFLKDANLAQKF